jgi:hypothetical protein
MDRIASRIESVTVFRRGAEVTRVGRVPPGAIDIEIAGLPLCLEDGSVVASYDGEGEARHLRVVLAVPDADPAGPPAEDEELAAVDAEAARLQAEAVLVDAELAAVGRLAPRARKRAEGEPPPASPFAARQAIIALHGDLAERLHAEQRQIAEQLREIVRRRDLLVDRRQREGSARGPASHELRKAITVALSQPAEAERSLRVSYFVPGARWAPAYGARLDEGLTRASLELRAIVAQRTGEDWRGTAMRLSTADRLLRHDLPALPARRIGRRQPPRARGWRAPPTDTESLFDDYRRCLARLAPPSFVDVEESAPPPRPSAALVDRAMISGGPMAPPPAAAPAAQSMAMPETFHGAAAMPMRKAASFLPSFGGAMASEAMLDLPAESEPAAAPRYDDVDEKLLDYDRLRMPPPSEATAGKLVSRPADLIYLETSVSFIFDLRVVIAAAREQAEAIAEPPERYTLAWSESYDHAFETEATVDVPSDGDFHAVALSQAETDLTLVHVVVPRESNAAFRTARLDNPLDAPLLPGPVDVHHGRDYLTSSLIHFTPVGGELRLGLGVEQGIKVARNARFCEESAGLIGNSLSLGHDVTIEIHNHTGRLVDLEVRERTPVVRRDDDEVKVAVRDVSPPWEAFEPFPSSADREALRGGHRWRLRLEGGGSQTLRFGYDVRIASKHELVAGNRREP